MFFTQEVLSSIAVMVNEFLAGHPEGIVKHVVDKFGFRPVLLAYTLEIKRADNAGIRRCKTGADLLEFMIHHY